MALKQQLVQKQTQSLVMTQQLQQSLKILQLSAQELQDFVEQELQENPFLQREQAEGDDAAESSLSESSESNSDSDAHDMIQSDHTGEDNPLDANYENVWDAQENAAPETHSTDHYDGAESWGSGSVSGEYAYDMEQQLAPPLSLKDHVLEQITLDIQDPQKRIIALHLVDMLDENGYVHIEYDAITSRLECSYEDVDETLETLQHCDPTGVFARSLAECLKLQLQERGVFNPVLEILLDRLELVAARDYPVLAKLCGVTESDVAEYCSLLRTLNPRPGGDFATEVVQPLIPDVYVRRRNREWAVELNTETLPRVLVNREYYAEIKGRARSGEDKQYVSTQINSANWLTKALHQRAETLTKVAAAMVEQQRAFLEQGIYFLKPMTLAQIAEKVGVHESTVGRVTTNKYIATPRGIYEMKYFFASGLAASQNEEGVSSISVKHMIQEMIESETPDDILSDDKLASMLKIRGVDVARRTVAKYREGLGIPTSSERKRLKRN
ncbi:MAG: RNA polymerase factor sigma-54 [Hyphomicrobiales bacterium]|nr:RNA polymerase factor sigma-54 [Hyphomicrobiales bacterium]